MKRPESPRLARWLVRVFVPADRREFILGDLEELYAQRVEDDGPGRARRQYWRDALASVAATRRPRAPRGSDARPDSRSPTNPPSDVVAETLTDLANEARAMVRAPAFHGLAILTLALGVGSAAAVFGMVNQLLLRPLPGTVDARRAAYLQFREPGSSQGHGISLPHFDEIRRNATLLDGMASYGLAALNVSVPDGRPIEVYANAVYGDFFEVLGVRAAEGRLLRAEDTRLEADALIAVVTPELATRLFGPGAAAVGRTIRVNGEPVMVVGVVGGGFRGAERGDDIDMWVPHPALIPLLGATAENLTSRRTIMHSDIVVTMAAGTGPEAIEGQVADLMDELARVDPDSRERMQTLRPRIVEGLHISPQWRERTYGSLRLLAAAVALVLLIACANVANLLLFRNVSRRGGLATRRALGASSGRLARQHLAASLLLATCGTIVGLGVAWLVALPFEGESLVRMPAFEGFAIDVRVLVFAGAVSLITAVLFGAVPAALAGRFDLGAALRQAGGRETRRLAGLRWLMAAGQIALSLTLLVGGLLLVRTVSNLYSVDTGLSIEGVAALGVQQEDWVQGLGPVEREVLAAVEAVPEVEAVALDLHGPHGSRFMGRASVPGAADGEALRVTRWPVTPGWFELFDVELVEGRPFAWQDMEEVEPRPVILTTTLARSLFGPGDAVGRRIALGSAAARVVGVTEDLRRANAPEEAESAVFVPFGSSRIPYMTVMIRTRQFDAGVASRIREAVEAVVPGQPIPEPTLLTDRVRRIHSERRIFSQLLGLLSGLAVALAAVGLYGVVAFTVAGRVREFGIRLALGAGRSRIVGLVLRDAAVIVLSGTLFGLGGAYLLSALLETHLFGVERADPASYGAAVLIFGAVAALACWTPARTATRVDPVEALTVE